MLIMLTLLPVAPKIGDHDYKNKLVLRAGTSAAIEIPFVAAPMPDATWTYKGSSLPDNRRFKTDTIIGMSSMTMAKVIRSDSGNYQLKLENAYGKDTFITTD